MTDEGTYEGATVGHIVVFDETEKISFPAIFKDGLGSETGLMVLVYKDRQIKILPLSNENVIFLSVEIGKLTNDFLTNLSKVFRESGLEDLLFATGVCLRGTRCYYECYFNPEQLTVSMESLVEKLNALEGIKQVVTENVAK